MVAGSEEVENLDATEILTRRLNEKEVLTLRRCEHFKFPIADGTAKLFGRDDGVREPTLREEPLVRSENLRQEFHGNSERSQPTETKGDAEVRKDMLSIQGDFIYRRHNEPRVQLHVPKEKNILYSTEIH